MSRRSISVLAVVGLALGTMALGASHLADATESGSDGGGRANAGVVPGLRANALSAAATPTPPGYTIRGIDVSSHDHNLGPIDWNAMAADGNKFAYIKATEGRTYLNPYFNEDYTAAKKAGLLVGAYHFARPDSRDPITEANFFIDNAQWVKDSQTLIPFLDFEWPYWSGAPACYGLTPTELTNWVRAFTDQVRARIGRPMMIYTNTNFWNPCTNSNATFGSLPLDIAGYTATRPPLPAGWAKETIWQYAAGNPAEPGNYSKNVFNGDYAALTRLTGGIPAVAPPIGFRAQANSRFVTAESAGAKPLIANRTAIGLWEQFDIVDAGNGFIGLRSKANGKYVTAENGGAKPLIANRTAIGRWEQFKLVNNSDGSVSLRANANGKYVTAESAGASPLIANRTAIGRWEKFDQYDAPQVVSLSANGVGRYVTAESAGRAPLIANRARIGPWEQFDLVDAGNGYVALRAHANYMYVTADSAGTKPLIANRAAIGTSEQFSLVDNPDGAITLKARANGKYVTATSGAPLIASGTAITATEKFYVIH
jgi:GH25 family lysozyme M1 (1,4-beta-N-acetylmuramidase)